MRKELEALYRLATRNNGNRRSDEEVDKDFKIVENGLKRLESIDNANPSEALECLEKLSKEIPQYDSWIKYINTIKQALLKAQEPKQYLKWEDLDFKENNQRIKVKLGSNIYTLDFYIGQFGKTFVLNLQHYCEAKENKQFFNDLHLERVEE